MASDPALARVAEAAALVDAARTGNDPATLLERLDQLAASCPGPDLPALRRHLFAGIGLRGDATDYHHERNSLLSHVLDTGRGLPILLSVVVADVGRTLGLPLEVIGMPGHVLVRHRGEDGPDVYLDAFAGGTLLDAAGCEAVFRRIHGPGPAFEVTMLDAVGLHAVSARILANLKGTYAATGDLANLRWVTDLRRRVPGVGPAESLDHAAVLDQLGRYDDAADVLDELAARSHGRTATVATHRALALRARAN